MSIVPLEMVKQASEPARLRKVCWTKHGGVPKAQFRLWGSRAFREPAATL